MSDITAVPVEIIEAEMTRLARRRESPEAFEMLCWILWQARQQQEPAQPPGAAMAAGG